MLRVRRNIDTDKRYRSSTPRRHAVDTEAGIVLLTVESNPEGDRVPPTPVAMDATPASVGRCQTVSLSLRIADDKEAADEPEREGLPGPGRVAEAAFGDAGRRVNAERITPAADRYPNRGLVRLSRARARCAGQRGRARCRVASSRSAATAPPANR